MIKAVVLDVDGIIVGGKIGVNFPLPTRKVIEKLQKVRKTGIPLVLCTAKAGYAIKEIIYQAGLHNPHISDGGAFISNPLDNRIIKKHMLTTPLVQSYIEKALKKNIYIEFFTADSYFVQKSQLTDFIKKRINVLQKEPTIVDSLVEEAKKKEIIKILSFAHTSEEVNIIEQLTAEYSNKTHIIWSTHPYYEPTKCCVITTLNVSKAHALKEVAENLGISLDEILAVGDGLSDWNFMQLCKYVATVENGDEKIKELIKEKGEGNYYIGPSVDNNGMIAILDHFL